MSTIPYSPGVYKITCLPNGKVYIGSTIDLHRRLTRHLRMLQNQNHFSAHLQAAWNLYGEAAFVFEVIETIAERDVSVLVAREQYWLDRYRANDAAYGFNKAKYAEFPMLGLSHTPEARQKIGEASRQWKRGDATRRKQSDAALGRRHTDAARQKMSQSKSGKAMSEEQRVLRSKCFIVTSPDGYEFEVVGLRAFCREHGLNYGNMQSVAAGRKLSCKGWRVRRKP